MGIRPVIGITGSVNKENYQYGLKGYYFDCVIRAGGLPVLLPQTANEEYVRELLGRIDGLILSGGVDVHPSRYGEEVLPACGTIDEERDASELLYAQIALEKKMPIFGVCRGEQVLAVALGATLFQDIESQLGIPADKHKQQPPYEDPIHTVRFKEGGLFARITNTLLLPTNSMHHQAVKDAGDRVRIEGITMDGIVEAISSVENDAVFAVQFHPEYLAGYSDFAAGLFNHLISKAIEYHG